jgi:hypothetical protein
MGLGVKNYLFLLGSPAAQALARSKVFMAAPHPFRAAPVGSENQLVLLGIKKKYGAGGMKERKVGAQKKV